MTDSTVNASSATDTQIVLFHEDCLFAPRNESQTLVFHRMRFTAISDHFLLVQNLWVACEQSRGSVGLMDYDQKAHKEQEKPPVYISPNYSLGHSVWIWDFNVFFLHFSSLYQMHM